MRQKQIDADAIAGIVLVLCSVFFYVKSGQLIPEAAVWPKMLLVTVAILGTLLAVRGVRKSLGAAGAEILALRLKEMNGPVAAFVAMTTYAVCMDLAGFFISTAIFLPLGMLLLKQRSIPVLLGVTLGVEAFVYWLFVMQLSLRMP